MKPLTTKKDKTSCHVSAAAWAQWLDRCTIVKCAPEYQAEMSEFASRTLKAGLYKLGRNDLFTNFKTQQEAWLEFEKWLLIPLKKDEAGILRLQILQQAAEGDVAKQAKLAEAFDEARDRHGKAFKQKLRGKPNADALEANVSLTLSHDVARSYVIGALGSDEVNARGYLKREHIEYKENVDYRASGSNPGTESLEARAMESASGHCEFEPSEAVLRTDEAYLEELASETIASFFKIIDSREKMAVVVTLLHGVSLAKLADVAGLALKKSQLYNIAKTLEAAYRNIPFETILDTPAEIWLVKCMFAEKIARKSREFLDTVENSEIRTLIVTEGKNPDVIESCNPGMEYEDHE